MINSDSANVLHVPPISVENEVIKFWLTGPVVCGRFKDGAMVDEEAAKAAVKLRINLQNGETMPLLLDISGLKELSKAGRDFLASEQGVSGTNAGVLLANKSLFVITMANIFFRLSRPLIPHRMFSDREKAMIWLRQFVR